MKKLKKNRQFSKSAIAFYIAAAITVLVFIYSMYSVKVYLDTLIEAGQISYAANWVDMMGYYLGSSNGFSYLLFAIGLAGIGYIISLMKKGCKIPLEEVLEEPLEETSDETTEDIIIESTQENEEGIQ